jgi:RNA polymerase sigma-70 factor (ECF subfamily)
MNLSQNHRRTGEAEVLLVQAKAGDGAATGRLLEHYRNYVGLLIRVRGGRRLRGTADADDLFQEIDLEIHRKIATFRGNSVREFLLWVRRMIVTILANRFRHDSAARRRDPRSGRASAGGMDGLSHLRDRNLAPQSTPSRRAGRVEQTVILADALGKLPERYREVIILRNLEGIDFPEVARRMGITEDGVKNVWLRALARLRHLLEEPG